MTKTFCDRCNAEITSENEAKGGSISSSRLGTKVGRKGMSVEIMIRTDGTANQGDYCKHCILDALYQLDDRPRAA
jgi:hypothetical protein